jgi:hypothetical protein
MPKRRELDDRLHRGSGLPESLRDAVVIAIGSRATLEDLPAARLGQNPSVSVLQNDDRARDCGLELQNLPDSFKSTRTNKTTPRPPLG